MRKNDMIKTLIVTNAVTLVVLVGSILVFTATSGDKKEKDINTNDLLPTNNYSEETYNTSSSEVTLNEYEYPVIPGKTFFLDKGNLKLYADVTPKNEGKTLYITGKEFHMDKELEDGSINDTFYLDINEGYYVNGTNTIIIEKYDGMNITIKDNRSSISLPFSGTLNLITGLTGSSNNYGYDYSDLTDSITLENPIATSSSLTVSGIVVDEYSTNASYSGTRVTTDFNDILVPSNERKDFVITAKYISSASNSGTLYEEIHTGTKFYTFGSGFPYNASSCNTVTITGTYRGNEQHFNGLQMDSTYPCFVTSNVRKPTEEEVK